MVDLTQFQLKPCPYCGGVVELRKANAGNDLYVFACVVTSSCRGSGLGTYALAKDLGKAVAQYNTRRQPPVTKETHGTDDLLASMIGMDQAKIARGEVPSRLIRIRELLREGIGDTDEYVGLEDQLSLASENLKIGDRVWTLYDGEIGNGKITAIDDTGAFVVELDMIDGAALTADAAVSTMTVDCYRVERDDRQDPQPPESFDDKWLGDGDSVHQRE